MAEPVLYDAVTLRHLACAGKLDVLPDVHGARDEPRWTQVVYTEIQNGANTIDGHDQCAAVLKFDWLGEPVEPGNLKLTLQLRIGMTAPGGPPSKNLGEAQSMALAIELGGSFATDDSGAYDFAANHPRLGRAHVLDACEIFQLAEANGSMTHREVVDAHRAIAAAGRTMHCTHRY